MSARHTLSKYKKTGSSFVLLVLLGHLELLALEGGELGEAEGNGVGGELLISIGHSLKTGSHKVLVEGVEEDGLVLLAFTGDADLAAVDVGGSADVSESLGVDGLEGAGTGALLGGVVDGTGGDDGAVGNENDGPLEFGFHKFDDLVSDLAESLEGAEGNADQEVLGHGAVVLLELDLSNGRDVDEAEVLGKLGVFNLNVGESLGENFFKVGSLLVVLLDNLGFVEHSVKY
jgi:hypothetical protein